MASGTRELTEKEKAAFAANPAFEKAALVESKQLLKKPGNDELLDLYGLYKVGCDEDIEAAKKKNQEEEEKEASKSVWSRVQSSYKGTKEKWKMAAWEKCLGEGLTPDQAQRRYIEYVEELKEKYGFDPTKEPEKVGR